MLTTFSGYDSQLMACDALKEEYPDFDWTCVGWSDIDKYACQMHDLVFPQYADKALGDITKIDWYKVRETLAGREIDLFTYSSPCFVAGTLVLTENGYKRIETVEKGEKVITHTNTYHNVLEPMKRKYNGNLYCIKPMCGEEIRCTPEHPFYVRTRYRYGHKSVRAFRPAEWKTAKDLSKDDYVGMAINTASSLPKWNGTTDNRWGHGKIVNTLENKFSDGNFWYLMGRYIGDGWTRNDESKAVVICCSDRNIESLKQCINNLGYHYTECKERTVTKLVISNKELCEFVSRYGYTAIGKHVDAETINLPKALLARFLEGHLESDGYTKGNYHKISTISREMAHGTAQCVAKVYNKPVKIYYAKRKENTIIEGRIVNQHDSYEVVWKETADVQDKAFFEDGYIWCPITHSNIITDIECDVYNMEVEEDHSYTANNVIVHNCTDISQAGKQMGLQEGSGTRSALLWNVADAIEVLRPKYLLQENVAALVSEKFMPDFQKWPNKLESLGYVTKWQRMNAKNYGVPQNRDRVIAISMRKDVAFDYEFPDPVPLEKRLEDVLEEEVDAKYFLKDDAVSKFMEANDTDSALFCQFDIAPTHEDAMFLKTWLQGFMENMDGWKKNAVELESLIEEHKDSFYTVHDKWKKEGLFPSEEFSKLYEANILNNEKDNK